MGNWKKIQLLNGRFPLLFCFICRVELIEKSATGLGPSLKAAGWCVYVCVCVLRNIAHINSCHWNWYSSAHFSLWYCTHDPDTEHSSVSVFLFTNNIFCLASSPHWCFYRVPFYSLLTCCFLQEHAGELCLWGKIQYFHTNTHWALEFLQLQQLQFSHSVFAYNNVEWEVWVYTEYTITRLQDWSVSHYLIGGACSHADIVVCKNTVRHSTSVLRHWVRFWTCHIAPTHKTGKV